VERHAIAAPTVRVAIKNRKWDADAERLIATNAAANAMGAIRANSMPFRQFRVYSGSGAGYRV
jgi:hypothetical protein